jgi:hypothetical protein
LGVDILIASLLHGLGVRLVGKPDHYYRCEHPIYHHGLRPNVAYDSARWGNLVYPMRTNSLGLRDREVREVAEVPRGKRVVLIGDSFTEGLGLPFEQTFAGMLQARFEPAGIEVLNAAAVSYAPIVYHAKIRWLVEQQGLRFDHLVVLLDLSDLQDEAEYYRELRGSYAVGDHHNPISEAWKGFLRDHTLVLNLASQLIGRLRKDESAGPAGLEASLGRWRCLWTVEEAPYQSYAERGLALAARHLDRLQGFLGARGIGLTVAVYPWPDQVARGDLDSKQVQVWRDWCARRTARFLDCFPPFIAGDGSPQDKIRRHYILGDVHWNEAGHRLMAQALIAHLQEVLVP